MCEEAYPVGILESVFDQASLLGPYVPESIRRTPANNRRRAQYCDRSVVPTCLQAEVRRYRQTRRRHRGARQVGRVSGRNQFGFGFRTKLRPKSYIPRVRGDQQSLLEAENCLGTKALGLIQVCQFAPGLCIGGYRVKELDMGSNGIGEPVE